MEASTESRIQDAGGEGIVEIVVHVPGIVTRHDAESGLAVRCGHLEISLNTELERVAVWLF